MPRPTREQWDAARVRWEADPALTFEAVGEPMGLTRQAVNARAKAESWERTPSLADVARRAQYKADKRQIDKLTGKIDGASEKAQAVSREIAEDIRADVIDRHRADWIEYRKLHPLIERSKDFDAGKRGKINAEALSLLHRGERAAYGLGETDTGGKNGDELWIGIAGDRG